MKKVSRRKVNRIAPVRLVRIASGLSLREFSERTGDSIATISRCERGKQLMSPARREQWAKALWISRNF